MINYTIREDFTNFRNLTSSGKSPASVSGGLPCFSRSLSPADMPRSGNEVMSKERKRIANIRFD